jgi:hypothetical protein
MRSAAGISCLQRVSQNVIYGSKTRPDEAVIVAPLVKRFAPARDTVRRVGLRLVV